MQKRAIHLVDSPELQHAVRSDRDTNELVDMVLEAGSSVTRIVWHTPKYCNNAYDSELPSPRPTSTRLNEKRLSVELPANVHLLLTVTTPKDTRPFASAWMRLSNSQSSVTPMFTEERVILRTLQGPHLESKPTAFHVRVEGPGLSALRWTKG
ncbi:hypothetical protein OG21DRAFT_1603893 [Imleria badia]|nr:hypothetical protein OG21DRAFT_1603893 [Imleria badia]